MQYPTISHIVQCEGCRGWAHLPLHCDMQGRTRGPAITALCQVQVSVPPTVRAPALLYDAARYQPDIQVHVPGTCHHLFCLSTSWPLRVSDDWFRHVVCPNLLLTNLPVTRLIICLFLLFYHYMFSRIATRNKSPYLPVYHSMFLRTDTHYESLYWLFYNYCLQNCYLSAKRRSRGVKIPPNPMTPFEPLSYDDDPNAPFSDYSDAEDCIGSDSENQEPGLMPGNYNGLQGSIVPCPVTIRSGNAGNAAQV